MQRAFNLSILLQIPGHTLSQFGSTFGRQSSERCGNGGNPWPNEKSTCVREGSTKLCIAVKSMYQLTMVFMDNGMGIVYFPWCANDVGIEGSWCYYQVYLLVQRCLGMPMRWCWKRGGWGRGIVNCWRAWCRGVIHTMSSLWGLWVGKALKV